ncbi:uncharacterized protein TNCV_3607251 [Trichonephila clavipes]|nr:uncharacterized protein TNCV_3607251 [Trichonephila clavipes]
MLAFTQLISSNSSRQKRGGGRVQIEHPPPYSLDLNPPDFLSPSLKLALKGKRLYDIPDIQRNVTRLLNSIPKEDFLQSFQNMYSRSQWRIVEGDYFSKVTFVNISSTLMLQNYSPNL